MWGREPNEAGAGPGGSGHPGDVTSYRHGQAGRQLKTSKLVALAGPCGKRNMRARGTWGAGAKSVRNRGRRREDLDGRTGLSTSSLFAWEARRRQRLGGAPLDIRQRLLWHDGDKGVVITV